MRTDLSKTLKVPHRNPHDYPDVDGDGCPDEPEIATDLNQLATAASASASGGIPLPNQFHNVRFTDGTRRVVLGNELALLDDCIDILSTVPIGGALDEHFYVELPSGGGNASLQNVLSLRASGVMMTVGTLDPGLPTTGGEVPDGPQDAPPVPEFSFYIYDHLGNTRVLYHNEFVTCQSPRYVLEHVLDYFPYGRTLREHAHQRDRFQTTYHERDQESGLDYRGARFYDGDVGRFLSCYPKAMDFAQWSTYNYVLGNPVRLVDPDGREPVQADPPKTILIFYHGGPDGNGQIKANSNDNSGYTGKFFDVAYAAVMASGRDVIGAVIAPSVTQGPGVRTGFEFLQANYNEGDQVVIYGYSYGGDNAVNLAERADKADITVNTLVIVDSSDGPLRGTTVDTTVPGNVEYTLNVYQTDSSGNSSRSGSHSDNPNSSEGSSSDGSSNSPGSRGYPHSAEKRNVVRNVNASAPEVTHGNIQEKEQSLINSTLKSRIGGYGN